MRDPQLDLVRVSLNNILLHGVLEQGEYEESDRMAL